MGHLVLVLSSSMQALWGGLVAPRLQPLAAEMEKNTAVSCIFMDIGGVLLSDGWGYQARRRAAVEFRLEWAEMERRHKLCFDTHQMGGLTLDQYLDRVIFHVERSFDRAQFRQFMFAQSSPYPEMLGLVAELRSRHGLKIAAVSNEGRELNAFRIHKFDLAGLIDSFISSCYIHVCKPNVEMFRVALDITQTTVDQVVYIENTPLFIEVAQGLGIRSILHVDVDSTRAQLADFGLACGPGALNAAG